MPRTILRTNRNRALTALELTYSQRVALGALKVFGKALASLFAIWLLLVIVFGVRP